MCFHFHCLFCKTGEQIVLHLFTIGCLALLSHSFLSTNLCRSTNFVVGTFCYSYECFFVKCSHEYRQSTISTCASLLFDEGVSIQISLEPPKQYAGSTSEAHPQKKIRHFHVPHSEPLFGETMTNLETLRGKWRRKVDSRQRIFLLGGSPLPSISSFRRRRKTSPVLARPNSR